MATRKYRFVAAYFLVISRELELRHRHIEVMRG